MESPQGSLGWADYVAAFRRRRGLMLGIGAFVLAVAGVVAIALPNVYESTAVFRLKDTTSVQTSDESYADQYVAGLKDHVLTGANERIIVSKFQPYPKLRDNEGAAMGRLSRDVHVSMITGSILDPRSGHDKDINTGFTVSYDNTNPVKAHEVAAWLASAFQQGGRANALVPVSAQIKLYTQQVNAASARISTLQAQMANFKQRNYNQLPSSAQANLNSRDQAEQELDRARQDIATQQQNRIFLMQQLQTAQSSLGNANLAQLEAQYKQNLAIYSPLDPDMIALRLRIKNARRGGVLRSGSSSLKSELAAEESVLAEARLRYSKNFPDVQVLERKIKSLKARIAAGETTDPNASNSESPVVVQLRTQIHATDAQISALQARETQLQGKVSRLNTRLALTPNVEREYDAINQNLAIAQRQYDSLTKLRSAAELRAASIVAGTADKFELLAAPYVPDTPSEPFRAGIIVLGLFGAVSLAIMAAIAAEALDGTVRGSRDVQSVLSITPLGSIPEIHNSVFRRRRVRQLITVGASAMIGIPILFICVRWVMS